MPSKKAIAWTLLIAAVAIVAWIAYRNRAKLQIANLAPFTAGRSADAGATNVAVYR